VLIDAVNADESGAMSGTLDQNAIRDAKLVTSVPRPVRACVRAREEERDGAPVARRRLPPDVSVRAPCAGRGGRDQAVPDVHHQLAIDRARLWLQDGQVEGADLLLL